MPVTPPLPAPSPKPPPNTSRVPQSVRDALSSKFGVDSGKLWPPKAFATMPVASAPTVPAIWPPRAALLAAASSLAPSAGAEKSDASSNEDTAAAVDAAASGSMPVSAEPPTTLSSRSRAPVWESSLRASGFALSVDTVLNTWVVAAADVPVPTRLAALSVAAKRLSMSAVSAASSSGVFSTSVPLTDLGVVPSTLATFEMSESDASPSDVSSDELSKSSASSVRSSVEMTSSSTRAGCWTSA